MNEIKIVRYRRQPRHQVRWKQIVVVAEITNPIAPRDAQAIIQTLRPVPSLVRRHVVDDDARIADFDINKIGARIADAKQLP